MASDATELDRKRLQESNTNLRNQIRTLDGKIERQQLAHAAAMRARERDEKKRTDARDRHEDKMQTRMSVLQAQASKPAGAEVVKERDQAQAAVRALKNDLERSEARRCGAQADAESKGLALDEAEMVLAKAGIMQNRERSAGEAKPPEKLRDCPVVLPGFILTLVGQRDKARKELEVARGAAKAQPVTVQA